MAKKYVVKTPKNQRPMIKDAYTDAIKKKMTIGIVPFIIGAIGLVSSMGQTIPDKSMRLTILIIGAVMFVVGIIILLKGAMDLNTYSKAFWEKEDAKIYGEEKDEPREKITWAQAKAEYKEEAKAAALEASRLAAEQLAAANAPVKSKNE